MHRVHKLEISISCFHSQLQQSNSPLRGFGTVPARFWDPLELRNISIFLAPLGTQVPTDFRLNNNLSRTMSHERGVVNSSLSVQIAGTSLFTFGSDLFWHAVSVPCPECIQCLCRKLHWHCQREEDAAKLGFLPDRRSSIVELDGTFLL